MKALLFGGGGQLAFDLLREAADPAGRAGRAVELVPLTRADAEITDADQVARALDQHPAEAVINTAAYNLVDLAEDDPRAAFDGNAVGPRVLARACAERGIRFLHFSTDYVFGRPPSGPRRPWLPSDLPQPTSVYGISKLAGEQLVSTGGGTGGVRPLVVRTCGLYGVKGSRGKGGNFVETMLRLADSGKPLRIVDDQECTPSYTRDIARATLSLVGRLPDLDDAALGNGIVHLTSGGSCTWYRFAQEIFRQAGKQVECAPITTAEFGAKAPRPAYSVLDVSSLARLGVEPPPPWEDALARYLADRQATRLQSPSA